MSLLPKSNDEVWVNFEVIDPTRHPSGFTVYKIVGHIKSRSKRRQVFRKIFVWKRFSDLKRLYDELLFRHKQYGYPGIFPPFCKPSLFGRFDERVIEQRRVCIQNMFDFVLTLIELSQCSLIAALFKDAEAIFDETINFGSSVLDFKGFDDLPKRISSHEEIAPRGSITDIYDREEHQRSGDELSLSSEDDELHGTWLHFAPVDWTDIEHSAITSPDHSETSSVASFPMNEDSSFSTGFLLGKDWLQEALLEISTKSNRTSSSQNQYSSLTRSRSKLEYVSQSGQYITLAGQLEDQSYYEHAYFYYKTAVEILIRGLRDEQDNDKREAVRKLVSECITKASHIYNKFLSYCDTTFVHSWSPLVSEEFGSLRHLTGTADELENLKVLDFVDKNMLVMDIQTGSHFIVKVLPKCSNVTTKRKTQVPLNVQFITRLMRFYDLEDRLLLVLERQNGGQLWQYIGRYQSRALEIEEEIKDFDTENNERNIYTGRHFCVSDPFNATAEEPSSFESDSPALIADNTTSKETLSADDTIDSINDGISYATLLQKATETDGKSLVSPYAKETISLSSRTSSWSSNEEFRLTSQTFVDRSSTLIEGFEQNNQSTSQASNVGSNPHVNSHNTTSSSNSNPSPDAEYLRQAVAAVAECSTSETLVDSLKNSIENSAKHKVVLDSGSQLYESFQRGSSFFGSSSSIHSSTSHRSNTSSLRQYTSFNIPETSIRRWLAEIVCGLQALHALGVYWGDFNPRNILLDSRGHIKLTFQGSWNCIETCRTSMDSDLYVAPELRCKPEWKPTVEGDLWSLGACLFELLTAKVFTQEYPTCHLDSVIFPEGISQGVKSLTLMLLKRNPLSRIYSENLRKHVFFESINWAKLS